MENKSVDRDLLRSLVSEIACSIKDGHLELASLTEFITSLQYIYNENASPRKLLIKELENLRRQHLQFRINEDKSTIDLGDQIYPADEEVVQQAKSVSDTQEAFFNKVNLYLKYLKELDNKEYIKHTIDQIDKCVPLWSQRLDKIVKDISTNILNALPKEVWANNLAQMDPELAKLIAEDLRRINQDK